MLHVIAPLALPVALGALAGAMALFDDPEKALSVLNRFALTFAFPALVFVGLADSRVALPEGFALWWVHPIALALCLLPIGLLARSPHGGTLALTTAFGNVAYLGLPVVDQLYGPEELGVASLVVAIHITLSLLVGPALLVRWGGAEHDTDLTTLLRLPLLWAPPAAWLVRQLPSDLAAIPVSLAAPMGRAAAPVALFLLGLYLFHHRAGLRQVGFMEGIHVVSKLLVLPAVTAAVTFGLGITGPVSRVLVVLAAMPTAITTFAIAQEFDVGRDVTARTVVASTLASLITLPAWMAWAG